MEMPWERGCPYFILYTSTGCIKKGNLYRVYKKKVTQLWHVVVRLFLGV